jgi:AAA+ ATPase superfamily predicted ATPase
MFKPITNPYIVGNPIKTKKMFYGREDDFEFIRKKLESGKKSYIIVLSGERRSGKTSILFQILNGQLGENFIPILIDMQTMAGLKNEVEFFEKFAQETIRYLDDRFDPNNYNFHSERESPYKVFSRLLNDMHTNYPYKNKLFLIDEYELIEMKSSEGSLSPSFVPFLSGILESERRISFIFTGSKTLAERDSTYWQNLFGKSLFRNVSFLSMQDTVRLITQPVENQITFSEKVLPAIYRLTSGQPFYTQIVGQHIVDFVNEHEETHISNAELDHIINDVLENPLPQMIYFWNNLPESQKLLLSLLAELLEDENSYLTAAEINKRSRKKKLGVSLDLQLLNTVLETLYHYKYVAKSDNSYSFQIDLMRLWIKRDHSIWRVLKEVNIESIIKSERIASTFTDTDNVLAAPGRKKRWIWPIAAAVIIVAAVTGWLLFKQTAGSSTQNSPAVANPTGISNDNVNKSGLDKPIVEKEMIRDAKTDEKPSMTLSNSSEKNRSKPLVVVPNPTKSVQPAINDPALDQLESVRTLMLQKKVEAENNRAADLAAGTFSKGLAAETAAANFAARKDYQGALGKYRQAQDIFTQAALESKSALQQEKTQITGLIQQIDKIQSELTLQHRSLPEYRSAESLKNKGTEQSAQGDLTLAYKSYSESLRLYKETIQIRAEDNQKIKTAVQGYARALESKNIAGSNYILSSYKKELENEWKPFFNVAQDIKITLNTNEIEFSNTTANLLADVLLQYRGAGGSGNKNVWKFELVQTGSDWIISKISEAQ